MFDRIAALVQQSKEGNWISEWMRTELTPAAHKAYGLRYAAYFSLSIDNNARSGAHTASLASLSITAFHRLKMLNKAS
jgi:hypothetical protein